MVVCRDAEQLPIVYRWRATIDRGGSARAARLVLHWSAPDLPAVLDVDREGPLGVDGIYDAIVDHRRGEFAAVIHQTCAPNRHEPPDVRFVDLHKRAVALAVETHALGQDVVGVLAIVVELFGRLP